MNMENMAEQMLNLAPWLMMKILTSMVIVVAFSLLCKIFSQEGVLVKWLMGKGNMVMAKTMIHIIIRSFRMVMITLAVLTLAGEWGFDLKPVLASLGIVSMGLALAAQDIVKNFIGAMVILVENIFQIGDKITVNGVTGVVESMNFRSTQLRTEDGSVVYVPNGSFSSNNVTKFKR